MNITRLLTVFGCFFAIFFLPDTNYFVIPNLVNIMTDETLVLDIIGFFLSDYISGFIFDVFHDAIQMRDLVFVVSKAE